MYDNVFEPIALAGCTIPNRIVRTGHGTNLRFPTPDDPYSGLMAYHEARAIGGVGMSFLEASPVHPSAAPQPDPPVEGRGDLGLREAGGDGPPNTG